METIKKEYCSQCHRQVFDNEYAVFDGDVYCDDCYDTDISYCECCSKYFLKADMGQCAGDYLCESCHEDETSECIFCNDRYYNGDGTISSYDNEWYCSSCFESHFIYCIECEDLCLIDDLSGGLCESCDRDNNGLHCYSYKPDYTFYKSEDDNGIGQQLYFGIELEIECENNYDWPDEDDYFYLKEDCSISDGFEVVSHPATYKWLCENRDKWDKFLGLRKEGFLSNETSTCGIHIHMTKDVFSEDLLYKFMKLIYENQSFSEKIAQRKSCGYAYYDDEDLKQKAERKSSHDRDIAVNLGNETTIEVRMFKGTLNPVSFWKNIEFLNALYYFARRNNEDDITVENFLAMCKRKQEEYPNLWKFLKLKKLVKED